MPDYVLTCRIYFSDQENGENAFNHIKALAEHSAAHDRIVGGQPDTSWARLHECYVHDNNGDTSECVNIELFILNGGNTDESGIRIWAPGQFYVLGELTSHNDTVYEQLQPEHTTMAHWEPQDVASIWKPV
jgi:hypothetical protein